MLVANKIDVDYNVVKKEFKFASKHNLPLFYVSAADGTNVVKVFKNVIREGSYSHTHSLTITYLLTYLLSNSEKI